MHPLDCSTCTRTIVLDTRLVRVYFFMILFPHVGVLAKEFGGTLSGVKVTPVLVCFEQLGSLLSCCNWNNVQTNVVRVNALVVSLLGFTLSKQPDCFFDICLYLEESARRLQDFKCKLDRGVHTFCILSCHQWTLVTHQNSSYHYIFPSFPSFLPGVCHTCSRCTQWT